MGNKLCKRKTDVLDGSNPKNQTPFDRIITRLHLRPTSWKSESYLNQKQVNRHEISSKTPTDDSNRIIHSQPLSKSSDWTDVSLEVPDKEDHHIHLRNPKLSLIFNNENGTPTPPPRKHKRNFREKIEAVAKTGLQALQPKTKQQPVEEPLFTKKKINYNCPICDSDEKNHNRDHHHNHVVPGTNNKQDNQKQNGGNSNLEKTNKHKNVNLTNKEGKRKKNLSVISLPNYNELKLTVVDFEDIDKHNKNSDGSLRINNKKINNSSTGKLDGISRRCRSFGSLLPQQLKKLKMRKAPADIESDDSFGGLEDWDLGLIEHYNPKDASLPRIRNRLQKSSDKTDKEVLTGIEDLIVPEEEANAKANKPSPPARQSESLLKKINKKSSQNTPNKRKTIDTDVTTQQKSSSVNVSPPPFPVTQKSNEAVRENEDSEEIPFIDSLPTVEEGKIEHSSLMRILQEFSMKDRQNKANVIENKDKKVGGDDKIEESKFSSNQSSLTPSLLEFEKNLNVNSLEEFINAEKNNNTDVNSTSRTRTNPIIIS